MSKPSIRNLSRPFDYRNDDVLAVFREIEDHPPRSAAIVAGALVEDSLRWSMETRFINGLADEDLCGVFEGESAPLASFRAKIIMGYVLGMYGTAARNDLRAIKRIRNAFAHAPRSITFETPQIVDECRGLGYLRAAKGNADRKIMPLQSPLPTDLKKLFFATVRILYLDLHVVGSDYAVQLGGMP